MAEKPSAPIRFSGPPAKLSAEVKLPRKGRAQPLMLVDKNLQPLVVSGDAETITRLALSLPTDTPPGEIKTRVILGDQEYEAIIVVQLRSMIRLDPPALKIKAAAGDTVAAVLNVTNLGNGTLDYQADQSVTLRQSGTLARSVTAAFKNSRRDFADRLIALGEEMAASSSHEFAVASHMSATTLKTGESATVELELGVPEDVEPDTTWSGSMALLGSRVRINVETLASP